MAPAALEPQTRLRMTVYLAQLAGRPRVSSELARLHWWKRDDSVRLAPAIVDHVIPGLRLAGLID